MARYYLVREKTQADLDTELLAIRVDLKVYDYGKKVVEATLDTDLTQAQKDSIAAINFLKIVEVLTKDFEKGSA